MPTVLDTAKEASYTALGLNVLFLDEVSERFDDARGQISERFAGQRKQFDEQLDIARDHAKKAQTDWQKQADDFGTSVKGYFPFDVDEVSDRVQPVARRTWEAAEPTITRMTELTPAPIDTYVKDGVSKIREFLVEEEAPEAPAKKKAKKPAAKKESAKKTNTRKPAEKKTASK